MARKRKDNISEVTFSYVGTDEQFDEFLKMLVHDDLWQISPMIRYWNGRRRVEYVCRGYQRNGKGYCSSHRIHEEVLDEAVWDCAKKLREQYAAELKKITQLQKQWALRKPVLDAHCLTLQKEIQRLEREVDELVMEKLKGDGDASVHEISAEI